MMEKSITKQRLKQIDTKGQTHDQLIKELIKAKRNNQGDKIFNMTWKTMLVGIAAIASIMAINTNGIAFADPQHCDRPAWPLCYSVGFDGGKANPGTSCPSGHSKNYCREWEHGSGIVSNAVSRLVPDHESRSSTSDASSGGKGTFKVTVEIFVSPRLSFDQRPPAFSVTIDGQQQQTKVHITENDERPMSQQMSDPVTSASTEFVLPKGQILDGQSPEFKDLEYLTDISQARHYVLHL